MQLHVHAGTYYTKLRMMFVFNVLFFVDCCVGSVDTSTWYEHCGRS